ncbi:hypothetical protein MLD38_040079 [Melastoma candidum]|uniref:Uncharacterized protein n=1 Tax=Melastoma candidum TaxID=119954 RepID=A0ACB9L4W5_9MYRT|nr:hypothetical protein MLD38_040079 [Melastoma candidum]
MENFFFLLLSHPQAPTKRQNSNQNMTGINTTSSPSSFLFSNPSKRKRRPRGTPDPDAEVVSLSPKALLESDRYVCEICNQGFQRDQNLQMHRRRHKVPWNLLKRERSKGCPESTARKRVYVCPEPSCLHHDPGHALGDLVGIKKHFRRKHSDRRQWLCARCGRGYAVQSDYKAHLKTCGTRGHICDCGRVFSRVESFIEHQDSCNMGGMKSSSSTVNFLQTFQPRCMSTTTASYSPSPCCDTTTTTTYNNTLLPPLSLQFTALPSNIFSRRLASKRNTAPIEGVFHNLDLQLSSAPRTSVSIPIPTRWDRRFPHCSTQLHLSVGTCCGTRGNEGMEWSSLEAAAVVEKAYAEQCKVADGYCPEGVPSRQSFEEIGGEATSPEGASN